MSSTSTTTTNLTLSISTTDEEEEEDYIDMELTSPSPSSSSSPKNRDFEFQFQMTSTNSSNNKQTITPSSADELFYNGKLLPLVPFITCSTAPCTNTTNTPLDSCNISPSESCRVSCELNPDDYFFEWSTELTSFMSNQNPTKKPWSKKLKMKLIKDSIFTQKLRASRSYLKSLFTKSDDLGSGKSNCHNADTDSSNKYLNIGKKKKKGFENVGKSAYPIYPTIASIIKNMDRDGIEDGNVQRRSFSGAIKRRNPSNSSSGASSSSSSSSFSFNSSGFHELQFLRRSSSATEIEGSIEAAIAHCKNSQQVFDSRGVGICSSVADAEDRKRSGLCSI